MTERQNMKFFEGSLIDGRYRLERFLAEGGFGVVFKASHLAYELELREVAVKIGKYPMTYSEARQVFGDALAMVKIADAAPNAALREHFVVVHSAGRCPDDGPFAGHPYMEMELIEGGSLERCLRGGAFPLTRAMAYFNQILEAMAFMHGQRSRDGLRAMIHRDIKPGNILVVRNKAGADVLKVSDFGLAVEVDTLLGWVRSGGDLAYLAPESFSHGICSPQTDVYMLGLVFYEMISGRNPFAEVGSHLRGTDEEKRKELRNLHLEARRKERFACLDSHPELRKFRALREVIRTALQVDMNDRRYADARALKTAWERAKTGDNDPPPAPPRPWEIVRRLTNEATESFANGDYARVDDLLSQATAINRDESRVPNPTLVGQCYLLKVKRLLQEDLKEEAGKLAFEGYKRRRCRSTCLCVARWYEAYGTPSLKERFECEAQDCRDQE